MCAWDCDRHAISDVYDLALISPIAVAHTRSSPLSDADGASATEPASLRLYFGVSQRFLIWMPVFCSCSICG